MDLQINEERLAAELDTLAAFSDTVKPAVTRIVYSETDQRARQWLKEKCLESGLATREDALGNLFARWPGTDASAPAIGTGSHIDAIPHAGQFDGTVGVLGGLEAIRTLRQSGFKPRRSIELLAFISEEPTRFGIGCLGSRMLSGTLSAAAAERLQDRDGNSLGHLRAAAGFNGSLDEVKLPPAYYSAFVELHIEQGPILEKTNTALGVVTGIAAPAALRMVVEGEGGHAGAVLMPQRHDALLGAAEIVLAVEAAALRTGVVDTVATTGICEVFPGVVNGVPSKVRLEIDVRDVDGDRRDKAVGEIILAGQATAMKRKLEVRAELLTSDAPAVCDPGVVKLLVAACEAAGMSYRQMVSRAYHDSLFMSRIAPTGMLFIPCKDGVSHRPDEYAAPHDISAGVLVLARTLAELANQ